MKNLILLDETSYNIPNVLRRIADMIEQKKPDIQDETFSYGDLEEAAIVLFCPNRKAIIHSAGRRTRDVLYTAGLLDLGRIAILQKIISE